MCELFGLSCDRETNIKISFTRLKEHSRDHPHGWGVAYYQANGNESNNRNRNYGVNHAVIIKEPNPAYNSSLASSVKHMDISSRIFISHIRYATAGAHISLNTHPFELSLDPRSQKNGIKEQSWTFAHNGHIRFKRDEYGIIRDELFPLTDLKPHGSTDSEYAFCFIMGQLRQQYILSGFQLSVEQKTEIIVAAADKISNHYPESLNFIMSDGYRLYCYHGGYNTLYFLKREGPLDMAVQDPADGMWLKLRKGSDKRAILIATKKLTTEDWKDVPKFMVVEGGTIVHSSDIPIENQASDNNSVFSKKMRVAYGAAGINAELGLGAIYCVVSSSIAQFANGNALTFDGVTIDGIKVYAWDERIATLFRQRAQADRYKALVLSEQTILLSEKVRKRIGKSVGRYVKVTVLGSAEVDLPEGSEKSLSEEAMYKSVSAAVAKIREFCEVCRIRDAIASLDELETFVSKYPESEWILNEHARAYVMIIERLGIAYKIDKAQIYLARLNELAKKCSGAVDYEYARALVYMIDHSGWDDRIPLAEQYLGELKGHVLNYQKRISNPDIQTFPYKSYIDGIAKMWVNVNNHSIEQFDSLDLRGMSHLVKHLARLGMFDEAGVMFSNMVELAGDNPRLNETVATGIRYLAIYTFKNGREDEGIAWLGKLEDLATRHPGHMLIAITWVSAILGVAAKQKNNLGMEYVLKGLNVMEDLVVRSPNSKFALDNYVEIMKYAVQQLCKEGRVDEAADKLEGLCGKFSTMDSIAIRYYEGVSAIIQGMADCGRVDDAISRFNDFKAFIEVHPCERMNRVLEECAVDVMAALARDDRNDEALEMFSGLVGQGGNASSATHRAAMRIVEGSCDFKVAIEILGKLIERFNDSEQIVRGAFAGYGNIVVGLVEEGRVDDTEFCLDVLKHLSTKYPGVTEYQFVEGCNRLALWSRDVSMNMGAAEILLNIKRFEDVRTDSEALNCVLARCFSRIVDLLTDSQRVRGEGIVVNRTLPEDVDERILMINMCFDALEIFANKRRESLIIKSELSRLRMVALLYARRRSKVLKISANLTEFEKADAQMDDVLREVSEKYGGKCRGGAIGCKVKDKDGNTIRRYVLDEKRGGLRRVE